MLRATRSPAASDSDPSAPVLGYFVVEIFFVFDVCAAALPVIVVVHYDACDEEGAAG